MYSSNVNFLFKGATFEKNSNKFVDKMNRFYDEKCHYLAQFVIDDSEVLDSIQRAKNNLQIVNTKNELVEKIKFNRRMMSFEKRDYVVEATILGSFKFADLKLGSIFKTIDFQTSFLKGKELFKEA